MRPELHDVHEACQTPFPADVHPVTVVSPVIMGLLPVPYAPYTIGFPDVPEEDTANVSPLQVSPLFRSILDPALNELVLIFERVFHAESGVLPSDESFPCVCDTK